MNIRKTTGFTLFELMLLLLLASILVVTLITATQRKSQESAAEQLGFRLYQYGRAVTDYVRQNPDNFSFPDNEPSPFYGYEWLQEKTNPETGKSFLGPDFSLDIRPLKIEDVDDEDSPLKTVLHFVLVDDDDDDEDEYVLALDTVQLGRVMRPVAAKEREEDDPQEGTIYRVDLSLAAAAAQYATEYRSREGAAALDYFLEGDLADDPAHAYIVGTAKPDFGISDYWLQTSGFNEMQGPVRFNTTITPMQRAISGLDALEFNNDSEISVVRSIKVDHVALFEARNSGDAQSWEYVYSSSQNIYMENSFCYLAGMGTVENSTSRCLVDPYPGGNAPEEWRLAAYREKRTGNDVVCYMLCIRFDE